MSAAGFRFESVWDVPCSRGQLWRHLERLLESDDPMTWWPSVQVTESIPGRLALRTHSRFGYRLDFCLTDLVLQEPERMTFAAEGDLAGRGQVSFAARGTDAAAMLIDWRVEASRPWMRRTSWILRPVFTLAHRLVMREGQRRFAHWVDAQTF